MAKADKKIYLSPPSINSKVYDYVNDALNSGWIAPFGPYVDRLEEKLKETTGASYCVALSCGTAALHMALKALDVKAGDTVFCSNSSFIASAYPIAYTGAQPTFIDSEEQSWNMCPQALEKALKKTHAQGKLPAALILAHSYGMPARMDEIMSLCRHYRVPVIEDAAEALGSCFNGKALGSFGEIGILSFNGNKIITTSAGGAIITNKELYNKKIRYLYSQAKDNVSYYHHSEIGYNYQMSNLCAAVGVAQLEELENKVLKRRKLFQAYKDAFKKANFSLQFQEEIDSRFFSNRWLSCFFSRKESGAFEHLRGKLLEKGIESRALWYPLHLQPVFKESICYQKDDENISERLFKGGLALPSGDSLDLRELEYIVSLFVDLCQKL